MFTLRVDDEIELRLYDPYKLEDFLNLIVKNHDHISPFMDWVDYHTTLDYTRSVMRHDRKQFAAGKSVSTRIYYRGEVAGSLSLQNIDKTIKKAEIGFWLGKAFTGKGIVTRASRALLEYGFDTLGLHKIGMRAMTTNIKSKAVAERLGFKYEGQQIHEKLHYGEYYDYDVYYLLESDWTLTKPKPDFAHRIDDKLELRLLQLHYADEMFALVDANRQHLRQWLPWVDMTRDADDTRDYFKSGLKQYGEMNGLQLGIFYEGAIVGAIGYHYWDFNNRKTEIGYWLAKNATGKGLMTRSVTALIDYAFDVLDLHRIEIPCATGNTRSCAIPLRLGFTHEGVIRSGEWLYDHYHDLNMYAILADEWGNRS